MGSFQKKHTEYNINSLYTTLNTSIAPLKETLEGIVLHVRKKEKGQCEWDEGDHNIDIEFLCFYCLLG